MPDELLEATTLCGPAGYIKERLAAYAESGVTHLNVAAPIPSRDYDVAQTISALKEWSP